MSFEQFRWNNGDVGLRWVPEPGAWLPTIDDLQRAIAEATAVTGRRPVSLDMGAMDGIEVWGLRVDTKLVEV